MEDITKTGTKGLKGMGRLGADTPASNLLNAQAELARQGKYGALSRMTLPTTKRDVGLELSELGYGQSKYDKAAVTMGQARNLQDVRAQEQPWYEQIGAGLAKMGVLAATTFLDGVAGTVAGIANVIGESAQGKISSVGDGFWAFIDNPFSKMMQNINEAAEELVPNYYSKYEQEQPWYTQIFTSNFIGDKFLKNLGFTIGAALSGRVTAGALGKVFVKKELRDAFKGVANAAGKKLKTGTDIYKAYKTGDAFMDGVRLTEDLAKSAKQLRNAEMGLKLAGSVLAAAGEGRIEAITNTDQWEERMIQPLEEKHKNYAQTLEEEMYNEHPEYFSVDDQGNRVLVNPAAIKEYNAKIKKEQQNYEKARAEISKQKASIGNSIFGLNVALLTTSNLWQFGNFIAGGYSKGKLFKNLVNGSRKTGYDINKSAITKTRIRALSNPLMEAQEEMSQAAISEGSGSWGSSRINNQFGSFYGGKIDPDSEAQTQSWLGSIVQGFADTYTDVDRWEEGFIGGLTGFLGIPKIKLKTKSNGKKGLSVSLDGELWSGLREAKEDKKEAEKIVNYLNEKLQGPDNVNYYQGVIRHQKYEADKDRGIERGDKFEYKNAEHSQIVSDAIMYDKAGRLQDLYEQIDEAGNVSLEDVKTIRELSLDKKTGKSIYENMSDQEVVDAIKKKSESAKKTVDKYVEISNNLKTLYGDNINSDVLEELTWGFTQVDNWESRVKDITKEIRESLQNKAKAIKDRFDIDIEVVLNNLEDFGNNFNEDKDLINDIVNVINDKNLTVQQGRDKINAAIKQRQQKTKDNNLKLGRDILKMRKKFKASAERLEKQREKALAKIDKFESEAKRLRGVRDDEVLDYEIYVEESKKVLREALSSLKKLRNLKKPRKGRKFYSESAEAYDAYEREIKNQLQQLEEGRVDIYHSFSSVLNPIEQELAWAEAEFNTDVVLDNRFRKGYDSNSKAIVIGNESAGTAKVVSEAEVEERHKVAQKNYNLLGQIWELQEKLKNPENQLIDPLEAEQLYGKLGDLVKILAVRSSFLDTYYELSRHPEAFNEKIFEQIRAAQANYVEKQVNKIVDSIGDIKTLGELRAALAELDNPSLIPQVLDKIKEEGSEKLKAIVQDYEDIEDMQNIIFGDKEGNIEGIVSSIKVREEVPEKAEFYRKAGELISDILDSADSFKEAQVELGKAIKENRKENKELAEALTKILDKYADLKSSDNTRKKDKKAERKIKGKGKAHKEDDKEPKEEDEEIEGNPESKKRSAFDSLEEEGPEENKENEDENEDVDEEDNPFDDSEDENEDEEETEPSIRPKEDDSSIVKTLKSFDEEELDEVIDGTSDILKDLDKEEVKSVKKMAELIKDHKSAPSVHIGSEGTNSESENETSNTPRLRSSRFTKYNIKELKDRKKRKAVLYNSDAVEKLDELGAFDFVDMGYLAALLEEDSDLPIYYLSNPSEKGLENEIVLAIEVTDEVRDLGANLNPIKGSDGKEYQVVGSLGYDSRSKRSVDNYNAIKEGIEKERGDSSKGWTVSKKYTNKVSHIYSGRIVKSTEDKDVEDRSLKEVLNGETPFFGIWYSDLDFKTPGLSGKTIVKPNSNNLNPREGSIWIMTKEADGRFYAKAVQVRRFTNEEWDFEKHKNTPIMEDIMDNLRIIADPKASVYERSLAKLALEDYLYFPGDAQFVFKDDIVSLKNSDNNTVFNDIGKGKSVEEKAEDMLKALEILNLRFQISTRKLESDESYKKDLIESDILTTDLAMLHNVNASFDMPLLDPNTGKPLHNVKEATKGHTGKRGIQSSLATTTIMLGNKRYSVSEDGTITLNNKKVRDQKTISEILLKKQIEEGIIEPMEGNSDLYIGAYNNGEEFGLLNGVVKTGKELKELKRKADKKVKEQKQKEAVRDVKVEVEDDEEDAFIKGASYGAIKEDEDSIFDDSEEDDDLDENNLEDEDEENDALDDEDDEDSFIKNARRGFNEKDIEDEEDDSDGEDLNDDDLDEAEEDASDDDILDEEEEGEDYNPGQALLDIFDDIERKKKSNKDNRNKPEDLGLSEEFDPSKVPVLSEFDSLIEDNIEAIRESGYIPFTFKKKAAELGIDISTINTQEKFEGLITEIRCSRK